LKVSIISIFSGCRITIDIAETACFALLGMMKTSSPIDCYVAFATIETGSTLHASTRANTAELEESIEDRTIITNVIFALLLSERVHVVGRDLLKEVDVLVGVELSHLMACGRLGALL
jgi:hypothetical protein